MKWIILLALLACTTQKAPQQAAGESDAKPVSPYSVQPCYCMKIYKPVCANGKNYGNSCEAECHGNVKWTEGNCPKK